MGTQKPRTHVYSFSQFDNKKITRCLMDMLKMKHGESVYLNCPPRIVALLACKFPQLIVYGPDTPDAAKIDEAAQKLFGSKGKLVTLH